MHFVAQTPPTRMQALKFYHYFFDAVQVFQPRWERFSLSPPPFNVRFDILPRISCIW